MRSSCELQEATYLNFFTFTTIVGEKKKYTVFAPRDTLYRDFAVQPRRTYRKGETIARGYIETGDQVFVDKMSYHFTSSGSRRRVCLQDERNSENRDRSSTGS